MEKFYNYYSRFNAFYNMYVDIAVTHYIEAKLIYEYLRQDEAQFIVKHDYIYQEIAISETFAAFAIESFLNDYAAVCLGDKLFKNRFGRLNVLGKVQLISGSMFHKQLAKKDDIYNHIKHTFSNRNAYAHNKSLDCTKKFLDEFFRTKYNVNSLINGKSENIEYDNYETPETYLEMNDIDDISEKDFKDLKKEINKALNDARIPLFALAELAYYVEENDDGSNAKIRIFGYKANLGNADNVSPRQFIKNLINELYELNKSNGRLEHMGEKINVDDEAFIKTWPEK